MTFSTAVLHGSLFCHCSCSCVHHRQMLTFNKMCSFEVAPQLLLLKCSLTVQTKRNQEKVVVTKKYFYGSAKIE